MTITTTSSAHVAIFCYWSATYYRWLLLLLRSTVEHICRIFSRLYYCIIIHSTANVNFLLYSMWSDINFLLYSICSNVNFLKPIVKTQRILHYIICDPMSTFYYIVCDPMSNFYYIVLSDHIILYVIQCQFFYCIQCDQMPICYYNI